MTFKYKDGDPAFLVGDPMSDTRRAENDAEADLGDLSPSPRSRRPTMDDVRKWFHYPIEMPVTADGQGPATVGQDAAKITYEVWGLRPSPARPRAGG
ncbi:hypothetical protein UFOVP346_9 [uncultured Caudovirales phage]|uniref:Uncharacterized protein n=1 Tax=uncultured Caudovirales phage TaxID=2100421 RepID=A0A6J5LWE6_9CAUD|nr:hypothetical protein UFOVP346_9 [uncultured Caudovirales phage]